MGQYAADQVAAELNRSGETMTLTRPGGASVTVKGKRFRPIGADSDPLVGPTAQNLVRIRISNAEIAAMAWPGPPAKGDRMAMAGKPYILEADADTRTHDGVIVMHILLVKG